MKYIRIYNTIFFLLLLCCVSQMRAQQMATIPIDPNVRIGKLSNGLTYYIRKNTLPEKRAFFYIAQKVGSIQEEPQQRGLAHFLEHMCFNGTKHFPGNSLITYLEKIGVKFGENLNAYTSIDETVYNINNVPVATPGTIDSCLLILHDWSNDLTLDPTEVDKERGVIHEEWRMRNSAQQRVQEAMMPIILQGSKYADSMPIGSMDVVMHFKPQVLRNYYEKWYRPDLQGIVVVGDINVDEVEAQIKKIFVDISAQPNAAKRIYYPVPDNKEPIVFVGKDKELTGVSSSIFFKHEAVPSACKTTMEYIIQDYATDMMTIMLNARLAELQHQSNPPFVEAGVENGKYFVAKTKEAVEADISCKENDIENGITSVYREILRARQLGFTTTEYSRARADYLRQIQSIYNERNKQQSISYVKAYIRNFLDNEPIPSIEQDYEIINKIAPNIPVGGINNMMKHMLVDSDMVIVLTGPEKAGLVLPGKDELLSWINKVKAEKLSAYIDKTSDEPLMTIKPSKGHILSIKNDLVMGTTVMTLSNGAKVVIKQTDFKKDEIIMNAISKGGTSLFPDKDYININNIGVISIGGLSKFSNIDLQKILSGKIAGARATIGLTTEGVNAFCSPTDLETMMQLVYLNFTAPRKDMEAFNSYKTQMKNELKNKAMNPQTAFIDTLRRALYGDNLRAKTMKDDMVDRINYDKLFSMYNDRFKNAGDFTFFFVGNVNIDLLKPMIEQYIATLPATHRKETYKHMLYLRKGIYTNNFIKVQETPKSTVFMMLNGDAKYNMRSNMTAGLLGDVINMVYTKTIREDASAAYSVGVNCEVNNYPKPESTLEINFTTAPDKQTLAMKLMNEGLAKLIKNGPDQDLLDKAKEFKLKKYAENTKENSYWMSILKNKWFTDINFSKNYEQVLKSITARDLQKFAANLYKQNNRITVTMASPLDKK